MLAGMLIILVIVLVILYSLGRGLDIADAAWQNRKIKEPCPYCGSMAHRKSWHTPKQGV